MANKEINIPITAKNVEAFQKVQEMLAKLGHRCMYGAKSAGFNIIGKIEIKYNGNSFYESRNVTYLPAELKSLEINKDKDGTKMTIELEFKDFVLVFENMSFIPRFGFDDKNLGQND